MKTQLTWLTILEDRQIAPPMTARITGASLAGDLPELAQKSAPTSGFVHRRIEM
jgi:hypothetical protein